MSDIEILILYKQAEAANHFNIRTGDCSGDCSECPASCACIYLTTNTSWSVAWLNFTSRINVRTHLSTLRKNIRSTSYDI